jgi:hypothetical protein
MRFPPSLRGRGVSIPERERVLGAEALRFIRENPGRYLTLCANRVWYTMRVSAHLKPRKSGLPSPRVLLSRS